VVLVTQGTLANHNFGLLIGPTLAALANEPDLLVVATAGGRPVEAIPGPIPGNARLSQYLPFEWVLPKVDVFVTNGGYGSVNQAMSFGIPLVTAGLTEDKADVNARVAWSGVGINLATNEPTPQALREAKPCSRVRHIVGMRRRSLTSLVESTRGPKSFGSSTRSRMLRMACGETTQWRSVDVGGSAAAAVRSPVPEVTIVAQQARYRNCFVFLKL
jgi:hypothetical protein